MGSLNRDIQDYEDDEGILYEKINKVEVNEEANEFNQRNLRTAYENMQVQLGWREIA